MYYVTLPVKHVCTKSQVYINNKKSPEKNSNNTIGSGGLEDKRQLSFCCMRGTSSNSEDNLYSKINVKVKSIVKFIIKMLYYLKYKNK